jgi:enterochelin esterase-like enzyme
MHNCARAHRNLAAVCLVTLLTACGPAAAAPTIIAPAATGPATIVPAATATLARPTAVATLVPPAAPITATAAPVPSAAPIVIGSVTDLHTLVRRIATAPPAEAQALADRLYQAALSQGEPLVLDDQVVFLYQGAAQKVQWRGAFSGWQAPGVEGARVGSTDLWIGQMALPAASRVEYKIVLNDKDWLVDPANPHTQISGLTGDNNVISMPGFTVTDFSQPQPGAPAGTLVGGQPINSRYLGYTVNYTVYTPAGYQNLMQLPVLYVLDGNDFVDPRMGAMPAVLDNLMAAGRMGPVIAVFVDEREPGNPSHNRREDEFLAHPAEHARFIVEELVPAVDQAFRTDPRPEARTIVGVSYGGISAVYIATTRFATFHNLAAFSPSMWTVSAPQYLASDGQRAGAKVMQQAFDAVPMCGGDTGRACPPLPVKVFLTAGVPDWDVGDLTSWVGSLRSEQFPVQFNQVREGHTWSHWRGQTDEMLMYFFGRNQT